MRTPRLVLCALATSALALAAAPVRWRVVGDTPGFPGLRRELQALVQARPGPSVARVCVVLRDAGDDDPVLYALWPQAHRLYRWTATRDARLGDATLIQHAPLDLRRDIVRTPADRLSTYKVTRGWVEDVAAQCRAHGETLRIARKPR